MIAPDEPGSSQRPISQRAGQTRREEKWALTPPSLALIDSPLDFLLAEHYQQRIFARLLESIADGAVSSALLDTAAHYIRNDLLAHVLDEEYSLFPALKAACTEADEIESLIGLLVAEHEEDGARAAEASAVLGALSAGAAVTPKLQSALREFACHLRKHLALENGVLLPLARVRLGAAQIETIADSIRRRRAGQRAAQFGGEC